MAAFHQTIVCGNLGRDPETRYLGNGDPVCNFSVAVTEKWKDAGGEQKKVTTWYRCVAYKKLAEICSQYLKKGSIVLIAGRMGTREWEKEGVKRESWELRADSMQMLGGRQEGSSAPQPSPEDRQAREAKKQQRNAQGAQRSSFDDIDDDIPF